MKPHPTAWESIAYLAGTERDSGDVVLSKRDCVALVEERRALLRRDWDTRVLNEWRALRSGVSTELVRMSPLETIAKCWEGARPTLVASHADPDVAQAELAEAAWSKLPEDVRAKLGARP